MTARRAWFLGILALAVATVGMLALRAHLERVHVALVYLLVVLGSSAVGGRTLGISVATTAFVVFNYLFLPPYLTLEVYNPLDWLVLVAFLLTGIVAAELLNRAQREASLARAHADEVVRLSAVAERAEALREADRLKDVLLATVSHDIRTPLTTIRALAQDIGAEGDERAFIIAEEVDRLNRFVRDLLDLSRLKAGSLRPVPAINAAEDLMGAALQRITGIATGREVRASLDTEHPVLLGRFDFSQALRIVVNLLENALKYSPLDSAVEFRVRRDGESLRFEVLDRGFGVPVEARARVFEPFLRVPETERRGDTEGSGLGLAIAQGLAEAQGGGVTYEPRDGGGSVFTLVLPAAELVEFDDAGMPTH
ncbi:MAG TPA: ATP-binding protein [Gemmatimonadaceae bacterium]|nr:ATP-binding protein [Gemmatimonadaceae bacterium]